MDFFHQQFQGRNADTWHDFGFTGPSAGHLVLLPYLQRLLQQEQQVCCNLNANQYGNKHSHREYSAMIAPIQLIVL